VSVIELVVDDLATLRDTWNDDITTSRLRNDSGILRKLMIDGVLGRAWKATGRRGELRVLAPDLKGYLGNFDRSKIVLAQAGGAVYRGVTLALNMVVEGDVSPGGNYDGGESPYREQPLSRYTDGPTIVARGVTVKRRELIQYVANKLGGVHYDEKRRADDYAFRALDNLPQQIVWNDAGGFDLRYYEMLAVGQLLVQAPDVVKWLDEQGR